MPSTTRVCTGARVWPTGRANSPTACIRCRYHAWRYDLDGRLIEVVDQDEFDPIPPDTRLKAVQVDRWGGFVWICLDPGAPPLLDYLDPLPTLLAPYHLDRLRMRTYLSTVLPANWKVAVDAFNEGYHVQGTHPQLLPWTDDVSLEYEPLGIHAHYGRLPNARRQLRPSPRLGLSEGEYDEGEILENFVRGLGGLFYRDERALVEEIRATPGEGETMLSRYQKGRRELLVARGVAVDEFADDQLTSADDVYFFPNMVGPIYPGIAIVFRVRPNGIDPDSCIKDTWFLQWPMQDKPFEASRAPLLPGLDGARLGRDHEPGLRQHGTRPDWDEVTWWTTSPAQPPPGEQPPAHAQDHRPVSDRVLIGGAGDAPRGRSESSRRSQRVRYSPPSTGSWAPFT